MKDSANKVIEKLLANTFLLSLKTKNFHWNVKGPHFFSLHNMFEDQYTELDTAVDDIAEVLRQGGQTVPASLNHYQQVASLKCESGDLASNEMVKSLASDHKHLIEELENVLQDDSMQLLPSQEDLLISRLGVHRKVQWMLQSSVA